MLFTVSELQNRELQKCKLSTDLSHIVVEVLTGRHSRNCGQSGTKWPCGRSIEKDRGLTLAHRPPHRPAGRPKAATFGWGGLKK